MSGVVIYIRAVPSLKKGDSVVDIGDVVEDPGKLEPAARCNYGFG
jgi:hypothetical protein